MEAMARVARDLGVRIRTNTMVEQIVFKGRRATGVRTRAGQYDCDALVINADFAGAISRWCPTDCAGAGRMPSSPASASPVRHSCSISASPAASILITTRSSSQRIMRNLKEIEEGRVLPRSPSLYIQNACVTDAGQAPQDAARSTCWYPYRIIARTSTGGEAAGYRALVLRLAALGLGDIERRIRVEKMMTPVEWRNDLTLQGATFNLAHSLRQILHLRPRNRFEDLESVYLVGGGMHPGSGLPVIFEGARITSSLVAQDLGLNQHIETRLPVVAARPRLSKQRI